MGSEGHRRDDGADPGVRALELGLCLIVATAPLPFGAVVPEGRAWLEIASLLLLVAWACRAARRTTPLPPRPVGVALAGLLLLAVVQLLPLGAGPVGAISPAAPTVTEAPVFEDAARAAEARLLGADPASFDRATSLSVDPLATASALRTGAALAALLLVATTVAALRGARGLAFALLVSAAFQGLYGLLSVAAGHDRIWHVQKKYFLGSATGTYVNRNHFACLLVIGLAGGLALVLDQWRVRAPERSGGRLAGLLGGERARVWLMGLGLVLGAAGWLLSYSRAGIALGLVALGVVGLRAGDRGSTRLRLAVALLVVATAALPLMLIGAEPLFERMAAVTDELAGARARVLADTAGIVARFPVVGSGFGSFATIYPAFRSPEIRRFFAHAHNDPLQALAEGGAVGAVLWLTLLVPVLRRLLRAVAGGAGILGVGFAAGLAAFLIHGLVDFNGHIPANAATAATAAGVLLGLGWRRES